MIVAEMEETRKIRTFLAKKYEILYSKQNRLINFNQV